MCPPLPFIPRYASRQPSATPITFVSSVSRHLSTSPSRTLSNGLTPAVHHHVQLPELLDRAVHQVPHLLLVPHVHPAHQGATGVRGDLVRRLLHRRCGAPGEDDCSALAAQHLRYRQADAGAGTRHYSNLVLKLTQGVPPSKEQC